MSSNPIDENATPKTTGSLEDLFRHHLGETAAVPPRPMLWDQIDNSMLVQQNETYRRRLAATRWVAAASLLLATLAGSGWWVQRDASLESTDIATTSSQATAPTTNGHRRSSLSRNSRAVTTIAPIAPPHAAASVVGSHVNNRISGPRGLYPTTQSVIAANSTISNTGPEALPIHGRPETGFFNSGQMTNLAVTGTASKVPSLIDSTLLTNTVFGAYQPFPAGATVDARALASPAMAATTQGEFVTNRTGIDLLATRSASLVAVSPMALPNALSAVPIITTEPEIGSDTHKWHYGANYSAGAFNPNINFSRADITPRYTHNSALSTASAKLTKQAAKQYRENLRPGITQRIALLATRHLAGHWSFKTGAEFSRATAKSASAPAFVGEQVLDFGQSSAGPLQTTYFQYNIASIPVEMQYADPVKRGWSLYGHLGGVVSALLRVRSEVEGSPEATRTYSITSSGTPYRGILGSLRTGGGAQFRSGTGNWAFTLGPVAEIGLMTLNTHPTQNYFDQSKAYSFGVEAGVEFGR